MIQPLVQHITAEVPFIGGVDSNREPWDRITSEEEVNTNHDTHPKSSIGAAFQLQVN